MVSKHGPARVDTTAHQSNFSIPPPRFTSLVVSLARSCPDLQRASTDSPNSSSANKTELEMLLVQVDPHFSVSQSLPSRTFGRCCQDRRALSSAVGAQRNEILDARRVFAKVAGSDSNKAKFSDHETRSDHSFPIWRSRANQGWLVFKSPKEVSCLVFARLHHSPISPIQVACQFPPSLSKSCMSRTVAHPLFPQLSRVFRSMMSRIPALRALRRSCLVPGPWFLVFTLGTRAQIPTGYMVKTLRSQSTCDSNMPSDQMLSTF